MEFSKDNIVSKRFSKKIVGGLSEFEVRDFLHVLAEEIRHLNKKNEMMKKQLDEQELLIKDYRDREHILKQSITSAEKWAEKIRKDAESHSALVLEKAQSKSSALVQSARHSLQSVYNDIADLKRLQLQFKTGLKAALQVQMDLLEQDPIFSPHLGGDIENFLEKPSEHKKSSSAIPKTEHNPPKEPLESPSAPLEKDQEISSLRESLSTINKNFS